MMIITIGFSLNEWSRRDVIRLNPFIGNIICAFNHDDDLVYWKIKKLQFAIIRIP